MSMQEDGWIGVDLDGTLAQYTTWKGPADIGAPIPAMVERVKFWLEAGYEVRIFTARIWPIATARPGQQLEAGVKAVEGEVGASSSQERVQEAVQAVSAVMSWCEVHFGRALVVTCMKDMAMIELYDDRAVQVEQNTGQLIGRSTRGLALPPTHACPFGVLSVAVESEEHARLLNSVVEHGFARALEAGCDVLERRPYTYREDIDQTEQILRRHVSWRYAFTPAAGSKPERRRVGPAPLTYRVGLAEQDPSIPSSASEAKCSHGDCPGERGWEAGYGLAGGDMGVYMYCPKCGEVKSKTQDAANEQEAPT